MKSWKTFYLPAVFRITFSLVFLWAFFDKLFGLGFSTPAQKSWIMGGSPTAGFLNATKGPFGTFFHTIAGNPVVEWLFMLGLLGIGIGLLLGIAKKITGCGGTLLMLLMWLASLPIKTNPLIDDHIIYLLIFLTHVVSQTMPLSLNNWWNDLKVVKKYSWLQ